MKNVILYIISLVIIVVILFVVKTKIFNEYSLDNVNTDLKKSSYNRPIGEVEILNGCGQPGIANLFTYYLRSHNYDIIEVKNADHFNYEETYIIINDSNKMHLAKELISLLKIDKESFLIDKSKIWEITIIIGKDYKGLESFNEIKRFYEPF